MRFLYLLIVLTISCAAQAQTWFAPGALPTANPALSLAAAGGLNSPQFSEGDLDGDGLMELAAFDRMSEVWTVFKRGAGGAWESAPDFAAILPRCHSWALLRDYNHDGRPDLFTTNLGSVLLYRNEPGTNGQPNMTLAYTELVSTSFTGAPLALYVLNTDVPVIADLDGDQDLDVITFENAGATLDLHVNQSRNGSGGSFDPVSFVKDQCPWGRFYEDASICNRYGFGLLCRPAPPDTLIDHRPMHAGSTETVLDADGDGDLDMLIGDVSCTQMTLLVNSAGPGNGPRMTSIVYPYPSGGRPASIELFPAPFMIDFDGDGRKDILAAPNLAGASNGENPHFARCVLAYRDAGTTAAPDYQFNSDAYLQGQMIDWGSYAAPCWIDIDVDGDLDLVLGTQNRVLQSGQLSSGLVLYKRDATGLTLADTNLLGYLARQGGYVTPFAADLTGDGRPDLGLVIPKTYNSANAIFIPMAAQVGTNGTALNVSRTDTLRFRFLPGDAPAFTDFDQDSDLDMLLGRDGGSLALVPNVGSAQNPVLGTLQNNYLGYTSGQHFSCKPAVGNFDGNAVPDVVVMMGDLPPRLYHDVAFVAGYTDVPDTLLYQNNTLGRADLLPQSLWLAPTADDLNGDGRADLTVGTASGGIFYFENRFNQPLAAAPVIPHLAHLGSLLGNPSQMLGLRLACAARVRVVDALGRPLFDQTLLPGTQTIPANFALGVYLVMLTAGTVSQNLRWVSQP